MKLKELRKQANLKQKELAKKLDIPYTTYNAYEISKSLPTLETLIKIADFYNVTLDYLLDRNVSDILSSQEYEFISIFNKLSDNEKYLVIGFINGLLSKDKIKGRN